MVTKDGLGDEDANLMIKLKFLTYKLRTFLIRNGLSILFKEGSSAYKAYYLRKCVQGLLSVPRLGSQALLGQNPWQELLMKSGAVLSHSFELVTRKHYYGTPTIIASPPRGIFNPILAP